MTAFANLFKLTLASYSLETVPSVQHRCLWQLVPITYHPCFFYVFVCRRRCGWGTSWHLHWDIRPARSLLKWTSSLQLRIGETSDCHNSQPLSPMTVMNWNTWPSTEALCHLFCLKFPDAMKERVKVWKWVDVFHRTRVLSLLVLFCHTVKAILCPYPKPFDTHSILQTLLPKRI